MSLKLYNTLTKKKEEFKPLKRGFVGLYSCGPTVYWYQHIGNLRSYIAWDILKRVLRYNGFKIKHVMNVTDVGHLTSDADTGEDKIEKAASREHKTAQEIANYYWRIFRQDLKKLNISEPDIWCKATEHIKEQIDLIKKIEKKGYTYKTNDGIYFDTSKLTDYGKLANLKVEKLKAGKRIAIGNKKNKTDFALWKFSKKPGVRQQEWTSPWGIGFPGWHIECSAMSTKYLGTQFDIHTGGKEHIPVHHTNEIAQSEVAFRKKPWVRYWLHAEWLLFKGRKMAKSEGNIYTISELEKKGFKPLDYRYFCLTAHYKRVLDFDWDKLKTAQSAYKKLKNIVAGLPDDGKINKKYLSEFEEAINDNLDMPGSLAVLWKMLRDKKAKGKLRTVKKMDEVFGLDLGNVGAWHSLTDAKGEVAELLKKREKFRKQKNFTEADKIRAKLKAKGIVLEDSETGPRWKKIKNSDA